MGSFYCQLDYEHIPYRAPERTVDGNLANNGCGVCSLSMVLENMMGIPFPPEKAAVLAKACGSRETYGTNLYIAAPYFAAAFGMKVRDTEDLEEAKRFLAEKRGMVIANVRGDREGYQGIFADSGHYVVIAALDGSTAKVWDPMFRLGSDRYDRPYRRDKVRTEGTDAYADIEVFRQDCWHRPYFLFEKDEAPVRPAAIGVLCGTEGEAGPIVSEISQAGGKPIVLSPETLSKSLSLLDSLDGLFIADESGEAVSEAIRLCREREKPVIATGKGFEAFADAFKLSLTRAADTASVTPQYATRLEALLAADEVMPVYGKAELPEGMRMGAADADGNIAALEWKPGTLCMALTQRPERMDKKDLRALLTVLVMLAHRQRGE